MRVHHLNCGSLNPPLTEPVVCHVLLIEAPEYLVLIDAGFGMRDIDDPHTRIGPVRHLVRPALRREETALAQIRDMGLRPEDVRHVIATHLDVDHIGGFSDFPNAQLHTTAREADSAYSRSLVSRARYRRVQLPPPHRVVTHRPTSETWRSFEGVTPLTQVGENIVLIPMPGHTLGHAAVAVEAEAGWILHCGDAFYHRNTLVGEPAPAALRATEFAFARRPAAVQNNHRVIRDFASDEGSDVSIISSHDRVQWTAMRDRGSVSSAAGLPHHGEGESAGERR